MTTDTNYYLLKYTGFLIPTNRYLSIQRYDSILQNLSATNGDVMIGTDQNFNYLNIERHSKTRHLFDMFISSGCLPTLTLRTPITHNTSKLIDHIYIKCDMRLITDVYHPCSNLGVGISELGYFIFNFASLPLKVVQPIYHK